MRINKVTSSLRQAELMPMDGKVTLDDGRFFSFTCVIPPTFVRRKALLSWMVDACKGEGGGMTVNLPAEPVKWSWSDLTMVAQPIDCLTEWMAPDGGRWAGSVRFPRCRTDLFTMTAEAVTAVGSLMKEMAT